MSFHKRIQPLKLLLLTASFLLSAWSAHGQSVRDEKGGADERPRASGEAKTEKLDDVTMLRSKVDQLQLLLEAQQRALDEMQKRLNEMERKTETQALASPVAGEGRAEPAASEARTDSSQRTAGAPVAEKPKAQDKAGIVAGWDKNHAFLRSEDGSFETQIAGYAQLDFHGYQSGNHPPNTFLVRRARIAAEGKVARYFDFRVEGDFADLVGTALRDGYVNIHRIDEFQFRFGQFRVPISQEEMRSDANQDFVERSMVNNLVPSRSPGIGVSGSIAKGVFEYAAGAFNGKGLLAVNNSGTPETAIRLRFAPWKQSDSFLGKGFLFGGAFTQGRNINGLSVRGITESRSISFFVPDMVNGKYTRSNGEFTWLLGPAAIRAEYDQTNQHRDSLAADGGNLPGVVAKGFTAQATYLLTGEDKPEAAPVEPRHNLFDRETGGLGLGAWELKFRYASLQIADGTPRSNRAQSFYFGPNWYMNRFVRYVLDLGFEKFNDQSRAPNPAVRNYFVILSRVQVAF
jgi:phosphate-selective porin OprO and OprP